MYMLTILISQDFSPLILRAYDTELIPFISEFVLIGSCQHRNYIMVVILRSYIVIRFNFDDHKLKSKHNARIEKAVLSANLVS